MNEFEVVITFESKKMIEEFMWKSFKKEINHLLRNHHLSNNCQLKEVKIKYGD